MSTQIEYMIRNNKPLSIQLLNDHIDEIRDRFPNCYFPTYVVDNPSFVSSRVIDSTLGSHQKVVFVITTPQGIILNKDDINICQLPKSGFVGRYTFSDKVDPRVLGDEFRFHVSKETFNDVSQAVVCDYWVAIDDIKISELSYGDNSIYLFESLDTRDLPEKLVEVITDKNFYIDHILYST